MKPVALPEAGSPLENATSIVRAAEPLPDDGETVSQGWFEDAVHVTVPGPCCSSRICCS
jgi:hypothetical protein